MEKMMRRFLPTQTR